MMISGLSTTSQLLAGRRLQGNSGLTPDGRGSRCERSQIDAGVRQRRRVRMRLLTDQLQRAPDVAFPVEAHRGPQRAGVIEEERAERPRLDRAADDHVAADG